MVPPFILSNPRLALYALSAVAASSFGQTFFVSIMVVSTAIAPVLFGFLLDMHISLPALIAATATGVLGAACLALLATNPK